MIFVLFLVFTFYKIFFFQGINSSSDIFQSTPVFKLAGLLLQIAKNSSMEDDGLLTYLQHLKETFKEKNII